jgi:hypothetical protein
LQGATAVGINKGIGNLSVFQEGSSNNFQFNYWCSPVGGNSASAGNSPFGITQVKEVVSLTTSVNPIILSANDYDGIANPLSIAPYWIFKLVTSSSYYGWTQVGSASMLNAGEGFSMKGTSGTNTVTVDGVQNNSGSKQRYDFRGKPNDGTISIPVAFEQLTLTGNPYPSAIDLSMFLNEATNTTGIAYFWEQDKTVNSHYLADYKGGYGVFSPGALGSKGIYVPATFFSYDGSGNETSASGVAGGTYERRFCPIGQGFMIEGKTNGIVEMKNSYRVFVKEGVDNFSQFEKKANQDKTKEGSGFLPHILSVSGFDYTTVATAPTPQIKFSTLLNNQGVHQMALAFIPEATDGVDHAMDASSSNDEDSPADVYFLIDEVEYVINAVSFDVDKRIPIGFRNLTQANYKISVKEIVNFAAVKNVYLHDKIADLYYDIKNDFHDLTLPAGVNNTQYEITFKNGALEANNPETSDFGIYQNNSTKNLTISNPSQKALASCTLYDVVGKLIFSKSLLSTSAIYEFSTANLRTGVYIVKLFSPEYGAFTKKIIIKN